MPKGKAPHETAPEIQPDPLETELRQVDPRDLKYLEKNARHMPEREFKQLVENIRRDGALTSVPLVYGFGDRQLVLSGNHRVKAATAAGVEQITVMVITEELTEDRLVAIQLSHNALVGEDDPNMLQELWASLATLEQMYSGLTEDSFGGIEDLDLEALRIGPPTYVELLLAFLPEDYEEFQARFDVVRAHAEKSKPRLMSRFAEYEAFFSTLLRVKDVQDITNDAVALGVMAELAEAQLDRMEEEAGGASDEAADNGDGRPDH
jgi:hypothetical protein